MIAAWVDAARTPPERIIAAGPALAIWRARFGVDVAVGEDPADLDGMACVLSGTGWASNLEHKARIEAAELRMHSVAVIDHWVNYAMRFEREGAAQLPDVVWVGDEDAAAIARAEFSEVTVQTQPNLYLAEQVSEAGPVPSDGDVLFLLEPARSDWGKDRPGEFQALDYFMAQREAAGIPADTHLRVRPHPSDPPGKFGAWIVANPPARLDTSPDMGSALANARWVVGMNSAGLVIALEAGREVISALPPHAPPCVLPHVAITRLCNI